MQMHKVLLIHISSHCNQLVTMLNDGNFDFPYSLLLRFPLPRFQSPRGREGTILSRYTPSHYILNKGYT